VKNGRVRRAGGKEEEERLRKGRGSSGGRTSLEAKRWRQERQVVWPDASERGRRKGGREEGKVGK